MSSNFSKYWRFIIVFLLLSLICGGIMLAVKQNSHRPVEISLTSTKLPEYQWETYIDGAVVNPGYYPAKEDDTIAALIQTAGITSNADLSRIKIYIPGKDESHSPQRISLNQADTWLLEALPGIGPGKAQAIVDYRNKNGAFRRIEDLLKVSGIGRSTLDSIKELITVED